MTLEQKTQAAKTAEQVAFAEWVEVYEQQKLHPRSKAHSQAYDIARKKWERAEAAVDRALRRECDAADKLDKTNSLR